MRQHKIIGYCVIVLIEQMGGLNTTHLLYFLKSFKKKIVEGEKTNGQNFKR